MVHLAPDTVSIRGPALCLEKEILSPEFIYISLQELEFGSHSKVCRLLFFPKLLLILLIFTVPWRCLNISNPFGKPLELLTSASCGREFPRTVGRFCVGKKEFSFSISCLLHLTREHALSFPSHPAGSSLQHLTSNCELLLLHRESLLGDGLCAMLLCPET